LKTIKIYALYFCCAGKGVFMEQFTLKELVKRRLDETYVMVYTIKNEVNIKKADIIEKTDVYTFIGLDIKGNRQFINMYQDRPLNKHFWLDCFEGLKSRGVKNILFLSVDDNKNMKRTAKIAFPGIIFVDSLTDIAPKFFKYTAERSSKKILGKIKELYTQPTIGEYKERFKEFQSTYNNVIHQRLIEKYLNNIEGIYKYSYNIRIMLFKHSANIYFYDRIRITFNQNNQYITEIDEIYNKLKSQNINNYFGFTSFKKKEWTYIINDIIQIYPDIDLI
jgi:transposase-like protein